MLVVRPSSLSLARLVLLGLMLLGFIAAPVLTMAGQTHAIVHGEAVAHAHDAGSAGDAGDQDDAGDAGTLLHAAMHASACCGHTSAIVPALMLAPLLPMTATPGIDHDAGVAPSAPEDLFRPPIAA